MSSASKVFQNVLVLLAFWGMVAPAFSMATVEYQATGPQPTVVTPQGKVVALYKASHALLVSVSSYGKTKNGWRDLLATAPEMDLLAKELVRHGFNVTRVSDPNFDELSRVIRQFSIKYGREKDNRVIIMFSGHGYTNKLNDMGYIVAVDALNPRHSLDFHERALPIKQLELTALEITARHALFIFDSCFSGSIFAKRTDIGMPEVRGSSVSERWRFLSEKSSEPVRQFIAAGGPNEELPGKSVFVPLLLQALRGKASKQNDSYVSGKEIGIWIEQTLPNINPSQTPHSDVIRDPGYIFGDMIFQIPRLDGNEEVKRAEVVLPPEAMRGAEASWLPPPPTEPMFAVVSPSEDKFSIARTVDEVVWSWPARGALEVRFDESKSKGILISNNNGTDVKAAADGKIAYSGSGLRGYGNLVIIKHNNTYLTAYAHNSRLLVKEEEIVKRGQVIAKMGATDSDRPGLHFEVRRQGKPVDPMQYLP